MKKRSKVFVLLAVFLLVDLIIAWLFLSNMVRPMPSGAPILLRLEKGATLDSALKTLQEKGVVREIDASKFYMKVRSIPTDIGVGTFEVKPGMNLREVMASLKKPIRRNLRIPEGWWISRVAARLEKNNVADAEEYIRLAKTPSEFQEYVDFKLPKDSLEGYLYPDTYDLPPLLGAKNTIILQLRAFESKVAKKLKPNTDVNRVLNVASIIELEAAKDEERPKIAGVIENRVRKNMRLEMDATVLYAIGKWKVLGPGVVRTIKSPYNTYLNAGLPPGPIGSPSVKSIEAALAPDKHELLFYVAKPDRYHLFATTYADHRKNINVARALWRKYEAEKKKLEEAATP